MHCARCGTVFVIEGSLCSFCAFEYQQEVEYTEWLMSETLSEED